VYLPLSSEDARQIGYFGGYWTIELLANYFQCFFSVIDMIPDTRYSLIIRLGDPADNDAWSEFESVYRPLVYRAARAQGLQDADAHDVVQQVMISISRALGQRPHEEGRAKFRTWLFCVTRNAIINAIQRRPSDRGSGHSDQLHLLHELPAEAEDPMEAEYNRAVFHWAADKIRKEFAEETWQAFWLTMVADMSCEDAAEKLGKEIGAVYAARSRIVRRLRKKVEEFDDTSQIL
jgi:RNA polymerase sigma factor (sigma-70 family)